MDEVRRSPRPAPDAGRGRRPARGASSIERATLADVVPAPEDASAPHDLARALAAVAGDAGARATALELPDGAAERALTAVADARSGSRRHASPARSATPTCSPSSPSVDLYGASTLEEFDSCSYRWFVNHELRPQPNRARPRAAGGRRDRSRGAGTALPRAAGRRAAAEPRRAAGAGSRGPASSCARSRPSATGTSTRRRRAIWLARLDAVIERYLRRDAATGGPLMPDPDLLEARFGEGPEDRFEPADFGTFRLHGAHRPDRRRTAGRR